MSGPATIFSRGDGKKTAFFRCFFSRNKESIFILFRDNQHHRSYPLSRNAHYVATFGWSHFPLRHFPRLQKPTRFNEEGRFTLWWYDSDHMHKNLGRNQVNRRFRTITFVLPTGYRTRLITFMSHAILLGPQWSSRVPRCADHILCGCFDFRWY